MSYLKLKKVKGEAYARAIREAEGGILEIPEIHEILRHAGEDPTAVIPYLQAYVRDLYNEVSEVKDTDTRSVAEILSAVGYTYEKIESIKEQEKYKKYYRSDEILCSFTGSSWNWKYIFMFKKDDMENIMPSTKPEREDDYSLSLLRVKLSDNAVSIVSRYNHTVGNGDAVFKCNLERIAVGLTDAFEREYGVTLSKNNGIRDLLPEKYHVASDGRILLSKYEQGGVQIGYASWLDGGVIHTPKEHEMVVEGCILSSDCRTLTPIATGSDVQGISVPWNDNSAKMVADGWSFSRQSLTIYATRKKEKVVIAELCY